MKIQKITFVKIVLTLSIVGGLMMADRLDYRIKGMDSKFVFQTLSVDYEKILSERGKELIKTVREILPD